MKVALVVMGVLFAFISLLIDQSAQSSAQLGYFLVASTLILSGALWKEAEHDKEAVDAFHFSKIVECLAAGPMEMESLATKASGGFNAASYREAIGQLLLQGHLIIQNGKIALSDRLCSSAS